MSGSIAVRSSETTLCTPSLGGVARDNPETRRSTPPGEGERRALSGYLPQYKVAAARILQAFEAGTLHAVAVADPEGGAVDDLQLLTGHLDALGVDGFQVKWSATAAPLADADLRGLICDAVAGRGLLADRSAGPHHSRRRARHAARSSTSTRTARCRPRGCAGRACTDGG